MKTGGLFIFTKVGKRRNRKAKTLHIDHIFQFDSRRLLKKKR
jgi:hypothetical protein